ncbi:hypothetical protein C8J57DRAFT_1177321 [Mycena rebaudengoi]|nr:hypothetical protein C8J57DRAFT_1177321 [Mycena rebaudengoi]
MTNPDRNSPPLSDTTPSRNRSASDGRSTRSHIRERMSDLDAQILALEQAPDAVRLERQDLQTRLDAYKYPILTLPTEITSEIFVHFLPPYPECPPVTGLFSPEFLRQICRTWREIALSTPQLWRAIQLRLPTTSPTKALDLLRTWVSRSKDCPLSISLHGFTGTPLLDIDVIQAIIPHSERWEHIDFTLPIESLRLIGADFPLLRSLTLGPMEYEEETDSLVAISPFSNAPLLKQVTLYNSFGPYEIQLPWSQFTSIYAQCLFLTECAEILQHSTALREFHCDDLDGANKALLPMAPLRHLHSLTFDSGVASHRQLLDALTTPALQHLTIPDKEADAVPNVTALILRSHCTLASLFILYAGNAAEATYRAAFPSIPTIIGTSGSLSSLTLELAKVPLR